MADTKLSAVVFPEGETDKQCLILLRQRGTLSEIQLRALARRYDEIVHEGGQKGALKKVLAEFDRGEVEIDQEASQRAKPPTLSDAPEGETKKTILLWLHDRGTLTMDQVRAAAALLTEDADRPLAGVLFEIGATAALPEDFEEEEAPDREFTPEELAAAAGLLAHNVPTVRDLLQQVDSLDVLDCLHLVESQKEDPRKGALDAIEERIGEIVESAGEPE